LEKSPIPNPFPRFTRKGESKGIKVRNIEFFPRVYGDMEKLKKTKTRFRVLPAPVGSRETKAGFYDLKNGLEMPFQSLS
jgi:hypothetical protein